MSVSDEDFARIMARHSELAAQSSFAVAVSGGPDSMALAWLLAGYAHQNNKTIYAYTVDHGLRPESAAEAQKVVEWLEKFPRIQHKILTWEGEKPKTRILEEARKARYHLLGEAAKKDGCAHLFVAHHQDDQAETFLIRLAKGSGVDGLAGMAEIQTFGPITLVRPLLSFSKNDLLEVCKARNIDFVQDPTNENQHYTRPRLRAAQSVLEEEGLTSKRLGMTAKRMARARQALEVIAIQSFESAALEKSNDGFVFDFEKLKGQPEDIVIRIILKSIDALHPDEDYGPRLERVENLVEKILYDPSFHGATLAGCIFSLHATKNQLKIRKEG